MIRHILFDLDNTLYSTKWGLDDFFIKKLREYTSAWLGLPWEECEPLWREAMKLYGTTLEWLVTEKGFTSADEYFAFIHPENEADPLPPDPGLRRFLEGLPCSCSVLTNAPFLHADRIIRKLGLEGVFKQVMTIEEAPGFRGKPHASFFLQALDALGLKPDEAIFVDDIPRYVNGHIALGGKGILIDENDIHQNYPNEKIKSLRELTRFLN